jgi:hypothetical protein
MTLITPVATYRAEFWTLNNDIAKWLATSEGNVLKEMCGELTVCRSNLNSYCMGRKAAFFSVRI